MNPKELVKRLKAFLGVSKDRELWEYLEIDKSTLSSWKNGRNNLDLVLIQDKFPTISLDWLTKETGIDSIALQTFQNICRQGGRPPTVLIPEKAKAGYASGSSQELDYELPIIHLKHYTDGNRYRFFEISGDSMLPTFEAGDYVLCELVESYQALKQQGLYVLHTHEGGLLCKRLEIQATCLLLHSDNLTYPTQTIPSNEVKDYWHIISFIRNLS